MAKRITRQHLIDVFDYEVAPAVWVKSGEELWVETGRGDHSPFLTGPVGVEGLEAGDTLAITIQEIDLKKKGCISFARVEQPWGGVLRDQAAGPWVREVDIIDGQVHFSSSIHFPVWPMVGWVGLILTEISSRYRHSWRQYGCERAY